VKGPPAGVKYFVSGGEPVELPCRASGKPPPE